MLRGISHLSLAALLLAAAAIPPNDRSAEILSAIKSRVDAKKSSGIVVATIEADGKTSFAAYGDPGPGALPLDGDSVFEIGSITKVFTSMLLVDMADRGEVKLDDPVEKFLPAGVHIPEWNGRKITLLDLATHQSGLPRLPNNMTPADPLNPHADYTADRLYAFLNGYELTRDIGTTYEYSNLGMGLLGHALMRRAGKSYEALITERVLKPLHMEHTAITLTPWMRQHLVKGHDRAGNRVPNWDPGVLEGAGALRSTANDMLIFARANLSAGHERIQRLMQQTHSARAKAGRPDVSIGLGWHVRHFDDHQVVWHNGGTGGYHAWIGFNERPRIAAIVLTNSKQDADDLGYSLVK